MGGSKGGGIGSSDWQKLEDKAKQKLKEGQEKLAHHVFISFAYEDADNVNLLRGQAKSDKTDLEFDDYSVKEAFDSKNADYIKRQIREKIDKASVAVVYLSESSSKSQWVNWEVEESYRRGKGVIGVYQGDNPPKSLPPALKQHGAKVVKWNHQALMTAIDDASKKR